MQRDELAAWLRLALTKSGDSVTLDFTGLRQDSKNALLMPFSTL